jgi:hypothetical protein
MVWLAALMSAMTGFGYFVIFVGSNDVPDLGFFVIPTAFAVLWAVLIVATFRVRGKRALWLLASTPLAILSPYMLFRFIIA